MKKEMLINVLQPEEIRIAIVDDGVLEELYVERSSHESYVGNIYKGRIVNIEPSIQAAFVDFGVGRNGFLHVSDVEPAYYRHLPGYQDDDRGRRSPRDRHRAGDRDRAERRGRGGRSRGRGSRATADVPPLPEELLQDERFDSLSDVSFGDHTPGEFAEMDKAPAEEMPPEPPSDSWTGDPDSSGFTDQYSPPAESEPPPLDEDSQAAPLPVDQETEPSAEESHPAADAEPSDMLDEAAEPRRRGRRRRGRSSKSGKPPRHESHDTEPGAPPSGPAPADEPLRPLDEERPRWMDSAEHRTSERDGPHEPLEPKSNLRDEDLSFSMAPTAAPAPARHAEAEPPPAHHEPDPERHSTEHFDQSPLANFEQVPLHEEHTLPGEPLPPDDFTPQAEDLPPPAGETDEYPVYQEYAPRERRPRDDRGERDDRGDRGGRGERGDHGRGRRDDRRGGGRGRDGQRRPMGGRPGFGRPKPPIQEIFKRGQEVLVQVIKEGIGTKGPTLSTYISIAGRYLVLMPGLNRIGVSRKLEDDEALRRLREIMHELHPPKGLGFIIRTARIDRNR